MESARRLRPSVQQGSIRAFFSKPLGRVLFVAFVVLVLVGSTLYLGYLLAIPAFLLTGLALPIWLGWKRPRLLLFTGLAAILVAGPIASALEVNTLQTPSPPSASASGTPYSGAVLRNATVHPFRGAVGGSYTFTVDVRPAYLPAGSSGVLWVDLFLSTCPGAISNSDVACGSGYPYFSQNTTYNSTSPNPVSWTLKLGGPNVWWWSSGAGYRNASNHIVWVFLSPGGGYAPTVEGPVTGSSFALFGLILPLIYVPLFLYTGTVYFVALLLYVWFKARERRRKGLPAQPTVSVPRSTSGPSSSAPPARPEAACPNCGAVVYAGETRCWKCGAPLTGTTFDAPLASGGPPTPPGPGSN